MCGIAGVVSTQPDPSLGQVAEQMNATLIHRGPDGGGCVVCPSGLAALASRRLAIIDLACGQQPMRDTSGRLTLVFNGEIYNYRELHSRFRSLGYRFTTASDTETVLAAFAQLGERGLQELRGMFAIAIWDAVQQRLVLMRDRLGKKPLYYTLQGDRLLFASELKAIRRVVASTAIDRTALLQYVALGYVPGARTMYRGIHRLQPGHLLEFSPARKLEVRRYWDLPRPAPQPAGAESNPDAWARRVEDRLREAVRLRLVADVPLGAFLSGGLDSSLVVALAQAEAGRPLHTFSIRIDQTPSPDADAAQRAALALGTKHHEEVVGCPSADELIGLFRHFDEPFGDSSMIPTSAVSRVAREQVTVALSGDGGDEMFGGYHAYQVYETVERLSRLPLAEAGARVLAPWWPNHLPGSTILNLLRTPARARYAHLLSELWGPSLAKVAGEPAGEVESAVAELVKLHEVPSDWRSIPPIARAQWIDASRAYLPGDILPKVDLASMRHSLEVRCPLLDHLLAEDLAGLPVGLRVRGARGKVLLRRIARCYLPNWLIERPKLGFTVPLERWLVGPFRPMVEDYLLDPRAPLADHLDVRAIRPLVAPGAHAQWARLQFSLLSLGVWAAHASEPSREAAVDVGPGGR